MKEPPDPGGDASSIVVSDDQELAVDRGRLSALARHAFLVLDVPLDAELSVSLVTEERIADLKERFFGRREVTDVLSFPIDDPAGPTVGPLVLGEVAICPEAARRQAGALGRSTSEEVELLLVHGILHLVGREHDTPERERAMAAEERHVLRSFRARQAAGARP